MVSSIVMLVHVYKVEVMLCSLHVHSLSLSDGVDSLNVFCSDFVCPNNKPHQVDYNGTCYCGKQTQLRYPLHANHYKLDVSTRFSTWSLLLNKWLIDSSIKCILHGLKIIKWCLSRIGWAPVGPAYGSLSASSDHWPQWGLTSKGRWRKGTVRKGMEGKRWRKRMSCMIASHTIFRTWK